MEYLPDPISFPSLSYNCVLVLTSRFVQSSADKPQINSLSSQFEYSSGNLFTTSAWILGGGYGIGCLGADCWFGMNRPNLKVLKKSIFSTRNPMTAIINDSFHINWRKKCFETF